MLLTGLRRLVSNVLSLNSGAPLTTSAAVAAPRVKDKEDATETAHKQEGHGQTHRAGYAKN